MTRPGQEIPPPHRRTLPHVQVNEQGMRELELWIQGIFKRALSKAATAIGLRYDFDNQGGWFFGAANDTSEAGGAPSVGYTDAAGHDYANGFSWQFDTGGSDAPVAVTGDGGLLVDTTGTIMFNASSDMVTNLVSDGTRWIVNDHLGAPLVTVTG